MTPLTRAACGDWAGSCAAPACGWVADICGSLLKGLGSVSRVGIFHGRAAWGCAWSFFASLSSEDACVVSTCGFPGGPGSVIVEEGEKSGWPLEGVKRIRNEQTAWWKSLRG